MKKILILNPLKDLSYWGLTTHAINIFPKFQKEEFCSYAFFTNPSFESDLLKRLPEYDHFHGLIQALRALRTLKPDILYGTGSLTELFFYFLKPKKSKYVIAWHGPYDKEWMLNTANRSFRAHISFYLATYLLSRADALTCDSNYIENSLRKNFPSKKITVTLNGVDGTFFNPNKRDKQWLLNKFGVPTDRPIFIFMGHLIKRKRPEIFVELARRMPEAFFIMAGREGLFIQKDIKLWMEEHKNLQWFFGFNREETAKLLSSSEGLVFPSLDEPFGLSVVEAMASGAPVVASNSGALPELIENEKEGFLVSVNEHEIDEFETKLRRLTNRGSDIQTIIKNARVKVEAIFNWESVARRYEEIFREV